MVQIGKRSTLRVVRGSSPGIYLDGEELGEILLPNRYVPPKVVIGASLDVFVYRDSDDRLVATTDIPRAQVGDIATLRVISIHSQIGAFLDWGLPKDLLLPFREQKGRVEPGQDVVVRVVLDDRTQRIIASMELETDRVAPAPQYRAGDAVEFMVTGRSPLGYTALVAGVHQGMLYRDSTFVPVKTGARMKGFVRAVRQDGKMDLSLEPAGHGRISPLALRIVRALETSGGRLEVDDDSPPEKIRGLFEASKKAFKQALGKLYKSRRIRFTKPGIELLDNSTWSPGTEPLGSRPPQANLPSRPGRSHSTRSARSNRPG